MTDGMDDCLIKGYPGLFNKEGSLFTRLIEGPDDGTLAGLRFGGNTENSLGRKRLTAGGVGPGGAGIHP